MSSVPEKIKPEEAMINIEIDGIPLKAPRHATVIEAADAAGIKIPRFCYHKKLSIAANCRMCMVEVEKVPKPLPACATPVAEGMKVRTRSPKAIEAQKGTMEFLLINHPLDCPICDEGGECELQETSMGYGWDHSDYDEPKRVVRDKDVGPLIVTFMTRCIHCTRCVRFGDEIAGMRELGLTGRGENARIGTYIQKSVDSELSGNVIELCPVGALLSKPFLYTARAWELDRRPTIAPHDCVGSNITARTRAGKVMRIDPRENEPVNECWISDRDRYSYTALNGPQRLLTPMIRRDGAWVGVDWNVALERATQMLRKVLEENGPGQLGLLLSAISTTEELYLAQKLGRALGSSNVDHRLRQSDFRDQSRAPLYPWLGQTLEDIERVDAALLVGSYVRKSQPLLSHRLRKAANRGGAVMFVNPIAYEFNFPVAENVAAGAQMERSLASVARAVFDRLGSAPPAGYESLLGTVQADEAARRIAARLIDARRGTLLLGDIAAMHPAFSVLNALASVIARAADVKLGYISDGCNAAGAWLAGAIPHREAGGRPAATPGLDAAAMFDRPLKGYLLLNAEPECDAAAPSAALAALGQAECVVALTPFAGEGLREYADVLLPIAPFSETDGTFVNIEGRWQSFAAVARPMGEARPAWKVLRVLGNLLGVSGFEYVAIDEIRQEIRSAVGRPTPSNEVEWSRPESLGRRDGGAIVRVGHVAMYAVDPIVRRSEPLQQTADARESRTIRIGSAAAHRLGLEGVSRVVARQGDGGVEMPLVIDDRVPDGCVSIAAGLRETRALGRLFDAVNLEPAGHE
jgi:NADH-quinone oxidoreductase subunit G